MGAIPSASAARIEAATNNACPSDAPAAEVDPRQAEEMIRQMNEKLQRQSAQE